MGACCSTETRKGERDSDERDYFRKNKTPSSSSSSEENTASESKKGSGNKKEINPLDTLLETRFTSKRNDFEIIR
jgi:hypothetical protein